MGDQSFLQYIGATVGTLAASFFGALLSLNWIDRSLGKSAKLIMVAGGFLTAVFCTPLLLDGLGMKDNVAGGISFFLALFSMSLIDVVFLQIKDGKLIEALKARFLP